LASIDKRVIIVCFLDFQVIAPAAAEKTYPDVNLRLLWFVKAASANPWKILELSLELLEVLE
jgi:hypothetical protein